MAPRSPSSDRPHVIVVANICVAFYYAGTSCVASCCVARICVAPIAVRCIEPSARRARFASQAR